MNCVSTTESIGRVVGRKGYHCESVFTIPLVLFDPSHKPNPAHHLIRDTHISPIIVFRISISFSESIF